MKLTLTKRDDGWWICDPAERIPDHGPYETKTEAEDDRCGLERFLRANKL